MILRRPLPPRLIRAVQIAMAFALLAVLWHVADGPAALAILARADPWWLLAALAALTLQTLFSALRWRLTAGALGIVLSRRRAIGEYYLSQIVNQSLPGGMIGDAGRAVRSRGQAGLLASGQAVVFERLAGQIAMFVVMTLAFGVTLARPGGVDWPAWALGPVMLIVAGGLALPGVLWAAVRLPGRLGQGVRGFWRALAAALTARGVLPAQVGLSAATTLCNLAAFGFCAHAVGAVLSPVAVMALVPLILFTMLIPISVSGWGLREGAAAALFPIAGATAAQGLAASIAFGLAFLVAVVPGVVPLWLRPKAQTVKRKAQRRVDP